MGATNRVEQRTLRHGSPYAASVSIGGEIWRYASGAEVDRLRDLLASMDDEQLREARAWYPAHRENLAGLVRESEHDHRRWRRRQVVPVLVAVWLGTPTQAAQSEGWGWVGLEYVDDVVKGAVARGTSWAEKFVAATARARQFAGSVTYDVVRRLCDAHGLDLPLTDAFVTGWLEALSWPARSDVPPTDQLRSDPALCLLWPEALTSSELHKHTWFPAALGELVASGDLPRDAVIARVVECLTNLPRPTAQRALTLLLRELGTTSAETPGGLPMLQGLIATCHGSATAPLVLLALGLVATEDELTELTASITGRPERAQRTALLRFLLDPDTTARLGADAVREALASYADLDDARLADRAQAALGTPVREPATATAALELWSRSLPTPAVDSRMGEAALDRAGFEIIEGAAKAPISESAQPWVTPVAVGLLNTWACRDGVDRVREGLRTLRLDTDAVGPFGQLVAAWSSHKPLVVHGPRNVFGTFNPDPVPFHSRWIAECLERLGQEGTFLSTPRYADDTLDLDDLVSRLAASRSFGSRDLLRALLGTRPVDPRRAAELDGLEPVLPGTRDCEVPDAVALVRQVVADQGLGPRRVSADAVEDGGWLEADGELSPGLVRALLPVDPHLLGASMHEFPRFMSQYRGWRVAPVVPDLLVSTYNFVWTSNASSAGISWWKGTLKGPGVPGLLSHIGLLLAYAVPSEHDRGWAVDDTLEVVASRRYDGETALAAADLLLRHRRLNLARCAQAWETLFLGGAMKDVWPVAMGSAGLACRQARKPPGLPDLFRLLTTYVGEVPHPRLPAEIVDLAVEKGSTKSHAEARRLVAEVGS